MGDEVDRIAEQYDVTDMQARIIDELADDPTLANSVVAERADAPPAYPSRIREMHTTVIRAVAEERGNEVSDEFCD